MSIAAIEKAPAVKRARPESAAAKKTASSGAKGEAWARRFEAAMPFGSSTCSKAPKYLPEDPGVIVRAKGCHIWDADGREYVDFRSAMGPVTLGYRFPATDRAIREQLKCGINFGHPHPLECEVAESLQEILPCAEQARFLKTGGEAIAACIKMARHFTRREHIIQVGYNGWLSGLAMGARILPGQNTIAAPAGVPKALSELHHAGRWNDLDHMREIFEKHPGQIAAVVIAADYRRMAEGREFYPAVRKLADEHGALLIFDEIVTGFRVAIGGVQEYFNVTPDLAVFAKGIANGMPLSVYAGRRDVMQKCKEAIVSSTYGGEVLSLAAAAASIATYRKRDVIGHLWKMGERMWGGLNGIFKERGLPARVEGFWPCPTFVFEGAPEGFEDRFFRASYAHGVSFYVCPYVSFSHRKADIDEALERMSKAVGTL